jgi:hypothetical protein
MDPMIRDMELLEYLAGRLPTERAASLQAQLRQDVALRDRLEALRAVWSAMDPSADTVAIDRLSALDLHAGVLRRLEEDRLRILRPTVRWQRVLTTAATWLVAIGLGTTAALLTPQPPRSSQTATPTPVERQPPTAEELAEDLYLDTLGTMGESDLAALFTDWDAQLDMEGS